MTTLATDSATGDPYLGDPDASGKRRIVLAVGIEEVSQSCIRAVEMVRGEDQFNEAAGMPLFETAFTEYLPPRFAYALKTTLAGNPTTGAEGVPGVLGVQNIVASVDASGTLSYSANIVSIYGETLTQNTITL